MPNEYDFVERHAAIFWLAEKILGALRKCAACPEAVELKLEGDHAVLIFGANHNHELEVAVKSMTSPSDRWVTISVLNWRVSKRHVATGIVDGVRPSVLTWDPEASIAELSFDAGALCGQLAELQHTPARLDAASLKAAEPRPITIDDVVERSERVHRGELPEILTS